MPCALWDEPNFNFTNAMSAWNDLHEYYRQWRALTLEEGEAIQLGVWAKVDGCQTAKYKLQGSIQQTVDLIRSELAAKGEGTGAYDLEFRAIVAELVSLEKRNSEWLADQKLKTQLALNELTASSRNLRGVRSAYGPPRQAVWQSYS